MTINGQRGLQRRHSVANKKFRVKTQTQHLCAYRKGTKIKIIIDGQRIDEFMCLGMVCVVLTGICEKDIRRLASEESIFIYHL